MPDLWPDDFGTDHVQPPLTILREQADYLPKKTDGLVFARVSTTKGTPLEGKLYHRFVLEVPSLDDYAFVLFTVDQPVNLYPVKLSADVLPGRPVEMHASDPSKLEEALRTFFALPEVRRIITALREQAMSPQGADSEL